MTKLERRKARTLIVRRSFEPSRIAPAHLSDAYERVIPVTRHVIHADRATSREAHVQPKRVQEG